MKDAKGVEIQQGDAVVLSARVREMQGENLVLDTGSSGRALIISPSCVAVVMEARAVPVAQAAKPPVDIAEMSQGAQPNVMNLTTKGNHNLAVGQIVPIAGVVPEGYNGSYKVTLVPSNAFAVLHSDTMDKFLTPYVSGGSIAVAAAQAPAKFDFGAPKKEEAPHAFAFGK